VMVVPCLPAVRVSSYSLTGVSVTWSTKSHGGGQSAAAPGTASRTGRDRGQADGAARRRSAGEDLVRVVKHDRAGDPVVNRLTLPARAHHDERGGLGEDAKDAFDEPATISRSAMYQKPATRFVSGRQARIPSTCSAGVCPLPQTMRPQMM